MPEEEEGDRPVLSFDADEHELGALGSALGAAYESQYFYLKRDPNLVRVALGRRLPGKTFYVDWRVVCTHRLNVLPPCETTIEPISSALLGIPTVDVGNPMLSMHSAREMAGSRDPAPMTRVLARYLRG